MKRGNIFKNNCHVIQGQLGDKNLFFSDNSKTQCPFGLGVGPLYRSTSGDPTPYVIFFLKYIFVLPKSGLQTSSFFQKYFASEPLRLLPFYLKIGVTLAILQSEGTTPASKHFEKIILRGTDSTSQHSRKTAGCMLSGPGALFDFRPFSFLYTTSTEKSTSSIDTGECTLMHPSTLMYVIGFENYFLHLTPSLNWYPVNSSLYQFVPAFLLPICPRVLPTGPLPVSVRVIWLKRFVWNYEKEDRCNPFYSSRLKLQCFFVCRRYNRLLEIWLITVIITVYWIWAWFDQVQRSFCACENSVLTCTCIYLHCMHLHYACAFCFPWRFKLWTLPSTAVEVEVSTVYWIWDLGWLHPFVCSFPTLVSTDRHCDIHLFLHLI